jgi:hypothetical protein
MRTLRCSEVGGYLYCARAWWYQRQGKPSLNQVELADGTTYHHRHGRHVLLAGLLRTLGWIALLAGLALAAFALTWQSLG